MRYIAIGFGLLLIAAIGWLVTRKPLNIEEELAKLSAGDRKALDALLAGTGVSPQQLLPVGFGVLQYHQRAIAVDQGRIVELRLTGTALPHPEALADLTELRALWLENAGLTTVASLPALKNLQSLHLPGNRIGDLAPLNSLAALTDLDVSGNQLTSLAPVAALPVLVTVDATRNPGLAIPNPIPAKWAFKSDANPTGAPPPPPPVQHPANWVAKLPESHGSAKNGTVAGIIQSGSYSLTGSIGLLRGAVSSTILPGNSTSGGGDATIDLSVTKGKVRAYILSRPTSDAFFKVMDGYVYAEAEPGKPGQVKGDVPTYGGGFGHEKLYTVVFESLDGDAEGIQYRIWH